MFSKARGIDTFFFSISLLLLVFGLFILTSASLGISVERFGYPYYYIFHQIVFGLAPGILLMYVCSKIPYFVWKKWALPLILGAIFLMFLVFVPGLGFYHAGAKRWLDLGPVSFQPAEFLKFAYVLYLAAWLETRSKSISSFKFGLLPFAIMSGFIASFLVLQPDIGTLGVLMATVLAMFFVSGGSVRQIFLLFLISLALLAVLIFIEPYRMDRLKVFLNPAEDPQGVGYQVNQALIAVGSGGFFGRGFGLSRQKFSYLPEPIGDSIFAIFAEELGFLGSFFLIMFFLLFFLRGIWISFKSPDSFGKFLGAGILFSIIFQALINISATVGMMPLTGIPLSFVSYGGSALALTLAETGILLNISKYRVKT